VPFQYVSFRRVRDDKGRWVGLNVLVFFSEAPGRGGDGHGGAREVLIGLRSKMREGEEEEERRRRLEMWTVDVLPPSVESEHVRVSPLVGII
jgi:hypothetical protein